MKDEKDYEAMKRSPTFVPSGLDEVFVRMAQRKAEAIAKGWIPAPNPRAPDSEQKDNK